MGKQRAARERDEKTHSTEEACRVERVALEDEHRIVMEMEDNIEGLAAVRTNAAGVASENGEIEKKETEVKKKQEKEQEKKEKKIEQEKQAEHKAEIEAAGGQEKFESKEMSPIRTKLIEMVEEKFGWLKEDDPMKALMGDLTFKYDTAAKRGDAEPASILSLAGDNILGPVADAMAKASDMVKNIPDLIFNRPDPREMLNKLKPPFEAIRSVVEGMKSDEDPMATKMLSLATNQKIANFVKEQLDLETLAKQMFERLNDAVNPPEGGQEPEKFELMSLLPDNIISVGEKVQEMVMESFGGSKDGGAVSLLEEQEEEKNVVYDENWNIKNLKKHEGCEPSQKRKSCVQIIPNTPATSDKPEVKQPKCLEKFLSETDIDDEKEKPDYHKWRSDYDKSKQNTITDDSNNPILVNCACKGGQFHFDLGYGGELC